MKRTAVLMKNDGTRDVIPFAAAMKFSRKLAEDKPTLIRINPIIIYINDKFMLILTSIIE